MAEQGKKNQSKKAGRNKSKGTTYRTMHIREKNKVRRVLRSSGVTAAKAFAAKHEVMGYLMSLERYKKVAT